MILKKKRCLEKITQYNAFDNKGIVNSAKQLCYVISDDQMYPSNMINMSAFAIVPFNK